MPTPLVGAILDRDDRPLTERVAGASRAELLIEIEALEEFVAGAPNLFEAVRGHAFLHALYRFELPRRAGAPLPNGTGIPERGWRAWLERDFAAALAELRAAWNAAPGGLALASALGRTHAAYGLQKLSDEVRTSVRARPENRWVFEHDAPSEHPLECHADLGRALLVERTPVRMDLSHSGWSDIFFLAMDAPENARVLNVSIDLAVRGEGEPRPPVEASLRVIDEPVLRLISVDLGASVELTEIAEVFDFARDHLGLLRAAVVAAGVVPLGLEDTRGPLAPLLASLVGEGRGLELTSHVLGIPKGSRLAVSTTLLAALIAVSMRATGQTLRLEGPLSDEERRQVAARAILGEWLGGSGGGWQDSGGLWPGAKVLQGVHADESSRSRGRLLPTCRVLGEDEFSTKTRAAIARSLVLVHGGLAQDVGPVLEQVTESYLLRETRAARSASLALFDQLRAALASGDVPELARLTDAHFHGPLREMVPAATNAFTEALIAAVRTEFKERFLGFWMLGGMAGGGMGFWFEPKARAEGLEFLARTMPEIAQAQGHGTPFAIEPVVYSFAINEVGTSATLSGNAPPAAADRSRKAPVRNDAELKRLLDSHGFDAIAHEHAREELIAGTLGVGVNRLAQSAQLEDVTADHILGTANTSDLARGEAALAKGEVAIVTLAGGTASRWSGGDGLVKGLSPFARLAGRHRTFLEAHIAKAGQTARRFSARPPHVATTSFRTHEALERSGLPLRLSVGRTIGLRFVPTERDLLATWEDRAEQALDERAERVRSSLRRAWIGWARSTGEAADYRDDAPLACVHPRGHGHEIPSLVANGTLHELLQAHPNVTTLLLHNVDTLGVHADPGLLGQHLGGGAALTVEVTERRLGDSGGSLALVDGTPRLVESLALRDDAEELGLRYYNTLTTWIDVDRLLRSFGLNRSELGDVERRTAAARSWSSRLPTYATLKLVRRRFGRGQSDVFPVLQLEQLWGDATAFDDLPTRFVAVDRARGLQLKAPADLDEWRRSGAARRLAELTGWSDATEGRS